MKGMVLGLWLPLKVEDKEDDGHCCPSCENQILEMIKACFALMCEEERVYALNFEISGGRSAICASQTMGIEEGEEQLDYL